MSKQAPGWMWLGGLGAFLLGLVGFGRRAKASTTIPYQEWVETPLRPGDAYASAMPPAEQPLQPAPEPHGAPQQRLAARALRELEYWDGRKETDPGVQDRLVDYWQTALRGRHPYDVFGAGWQSKQPWSAAFISHVANETLPGSLSRAASHWVYTRRALPKGPVPPADGGFVAQNPAETPVQVGDIIVKNRSGKQRTWEDLSDVQYSPSHGDLVVGLSNGGRTAVGVGGNLSHSVQRRRHALDTEGRAPDAIAVLRYHPPEPLSFV